MVRQLFPVPSTSSPPYLVQSYGMMQTPESWAETNGTILGLQFSNSTTFLKKIVTMWYRQRKPLLFHSRSHTHTRFHYRQERINQIPVKGFLRESKEGRVTRERLTEVTDSHLVLCHAAVTQLPQGRECADYKLNGKSGPRYSKSWKCTAIMLPHLCRQQVTGLGL